MWFNWRQHAAHIKTLTPVNNSYTVLLVQDQCWLALLLTGEIISGFRLSVSVKIKSNFYALRLWLATWESPLLPLPYLKWGRAVGEGCVCEIPLDCGILSTDCLDDWVSKKKCKSLHLAGERSLNWNKTPCWYSCRSMCLTYVDFYRLMLGWRHLQPILDPVSYFLSVLETEVGRLRKSLKTHEVFLVISSPLADSCTAWWSWLTTPCSLLRRLQTSLTLYVSADWWMGLFVGSPAVGFNGTGWPDAARCQSFKTRRGKSLSAELVRPDLCVHRDRTNEKWGGSDARDYRPKAVWESSANIRTPIHFSSNF